MSLLLCNLCKRSQKFCRIHISKVLDIIIVQLSGRLHGHETKVFIFIIMKNPLTTDHYIKGLYQPGEFFCQSLRECICLSI